MLAGTDKAAKNLCDSLRNDGIPAQYADKLSEIKKNALFVLPGTLSAGFEYPLEKFFIITQGHISYVPKKKARKKNIKGQAGRFTAFRSFRRAIMWYTAFTV